MLIWNEKTSASNSERQILHTATERLGSLAIVAIAREGRQVTLVSRELCDLAARVGASDIIPPTGTVRSDPWIEIQAGDRTPKDLIRAINDRIREYSQIRVTGAGIGPLTVPEHLL